MNQKTWHYARTTLAKQVVGMFDSGLSSALTFFAPRRMGKTEFLRRDILPYAESHGWYVFYFSFLDTGPGAGVEFVESLYEFAKSKSVVIRAKDIFGRVHKLSGSIAGLKADMEFQDKLLPGLKELIAKLGRKGNTLLLLDEGQALANHAENARFIAALRTALDINKDTVKVIFTGSSREGLRRMFSEASAPFFHFSQNLVFPNLGRGFTDHLSKVYRDMTRRKISADHLWEAFEDLGYVPQLIRALVERMVLDPSLTINVAKEQLMQDVSGDRGFAGLWSSRSALEQQLLVAIAREETGLFSEQRRVHWAKKLGTSSLPVSAVQSALRSLLKAGIIGRIAQRGSYCLDDSNFCSWVLQEKSKTC